MPHSSLPILPPELVRELASAVTKLHDEAALLSASKLTPEQFRGRRVAHGIYEQRRGGTFMLRVRLTAGLIDVNQLQGLARIALDAGASRLHVTTRQALQLHDLSLQAALRVQSELLELGLTSYGSGGSTVRNIVSDPLSGVLSDEAFDVRPYALSVAASYTVPSQQPNLPRKFKIAFSASAADRAEAKLADLGFIATRQGASYGFRVFVGGGLGLGAIGGLELCPWIAAERALDVTAGILKFFADHGDRENRHKARLRHVRKRLGDSQFIALCNQYVENASQSGLLPVELSNQLLAFAARPAQAPVAPTPLPAALRQLKRILPEREPGRFSVGLAPLHGDVKPVSLLTLAEAVTGIGSTIVRLGLEQDLWITGLDGSQLTHLLARLRGLELGTPNEPVQSIMACSGAATCQLGLLQSRAAADAVAAALNRQSTTWDTDAIRISGCMNACSRHISAKLGFEGRVRRVNGRLLPSYAVYARSPSDASGTPLAQVIGVVPAKVLPELVVALHLVTGNLSLTPNDVAIQQQAIVERFAKIPELLPEDWYFDWGQNSPFSLNGLGAGECAASV